MSKKDFIALADAIMAHNQRGGLGFDRNQLETLADVCYATNNAFRRDRWMAYINGECGPNGGDMKGGIHKGRKRVI